MRKTLSRYRLTALTPPLPWEGQLLALRRTWHGSVAKMGKLNSAC